MKESPTSRLLSPPNNNHAFRRHSPYGKSVVARGSLTEADVSAEIQAHRQQKAAKR